MARVPGFPGASRQYLESSGLAGAAVASLFSNVVSVAWVGPGRQLHISSNMQFLVVTGAAETMHVGQSKSPSVGRIKDCTIVRSCDFTGLGRAGAGTTYFADSITLLVVQRSHVVKRVILSVVRVVEQTLCQRVSV
jgi:hypothetical protein